MALFGVLPELAQQAGWAPSLLLFGAGYGLLIAIDRFGYPVCPTCAHDHDHGSCSTELHGFAAPLIAAAAVHSFLDGWSIATAQWAAPLGLRVAVPLAVALHKIPEGIALGGILRASVSSRRMALAWCILAEGSTLLGGVAGVVMAPRLGTGWILYPLGLTAGVGLLPRISRRPRGVEALRAGPGVCLGAYGRCGRGCPSARGRGAVPVGGAFHAVEA